MTNAERLAQERERLGKYLTAETAILKGAQSYTIGNRTLTRADLEEIRNQVNRLTKHIQQLERGGNIRIQRIMPRDI